MLSQGEGIISDATGRYREFENYRDHLGGLWLDRNTYKKQYDDAIGWCHDWLNNIHERTKKWLQLLSVTSKNTNS